jgi:hypothetical protein
MHRRTLVQSLLAVGGSLIRIPSPSQNVPGSGGGPDLPGITGVNLRANEIDQVTLDLVERGGFGWIRTDIRWDEIETKPGSFDFELIASRLKRVVDKGIKVLGILDYGHPYHTRSLAPHSGEERKAFATFASRAIEEIGRLVSAWEVWNEPNHPRFWRSSPDPDAYAELLTTVAGRIWAEHPNTTIVSGGLSTIDFGYVSRLLPTIEQLARQGPIGIGLHPYRASAPETVLDDLVRANLLTPDGQAASPKGVKVWFTEWGYWRGTGDVDIAKQETWVPRIPLVGAALAVPVTIVFELRDGGPESIASNTYGFVSRDNSPYPVWDSWQSVVKAARTVSLEMRAFPVGEQRGWAVGSCASAVAWAGRADSSGRDELRPDVSTLGRAQVQYLTARAAASYWTERRNACR